jgi:hypothetical protein
VAQRTNHLKHTVMPVRLNGPDRGPNAGGPARAKGPNGLVVIILDAPPSQLLTIIDSPIQFTIVPINSAGTHEI